MIGKSKDFLTMRVSIQPFSIALQVPLKKTYLAGCIHGKSTINPLLVKKGAMYVQEQLKQLSDMKVSVKEKQIKSSQLPLKKNCFFYRFQLYLLTRQH